MTMTRFPPDIIETVDTALQRFFGPDRIVDPALAEAVAELMVARDERAAGIAEAVRMRLEAGRKRPLAQIDEHVAGIADNIAKAIRGKA